MFRKDNTGSGTASYAETAGMATPQASDCCTRCFTLQEALGSKAQPQWPGLFALALGFSLLAKMTEAGQWGE